jgi:biotin transport system substrate-specific component
MPVLADLIPRTQVRNVMLVLGAAMLTAAAAQIVLPLPFSPVPLTGQTFAVLLTAAALGPARGALAQSVYLLLGMAGLPFYAGGQSGVQVVVGATGGYLVGFIAAAALTGWLARRRFDRRPLAMGIAFLVGSLVIYSFGVPWLAVVSGMPLRDAVMHGAAVFVIGDAVKAVLAAGLLPTAWTLLER